MESAFQAHPVPQNVTNFEFHLIGDMTIKQFGYLAAGLVFAFLVFITLAQPQPFIAWPIMIISSGVGAAFAFVPIQERPLDHWMAAFFKAIFKPTKLVYASKFVQKDDPFFNRRLNMYQNSHKNLPPASSSLLISNQTDTATSSGKKQTLADRILAKEDTIRQDLQQEKEEESMVTQHKQALASPPTSSNIPAPIVNTVQIKPQLSPLPQISVTPQSALPPTMVALGSSPASATASQIQQPAAAPVSNINQQAIPTSQAAPSLNTPAPEQHATSIQADAQPKQEKIVKQEDLKKTVELAKEAQDTQAKIRQIETQLTQIKSMVAKPGADPNFYVDQFQNLLTDLQKLNEHASSTAHNLAVVSRSSEQIPSKEPSPAPAKIVPSVKLTSFPNVVNGIVTDSQGNYVEGAIIVAHDKQGLPVRALKSNKLGQFVAATPLPSGGYTIVAEKEGLMFENLSIELKNDILQPVMISARKQQLVSGVAGQV
jgi:hypothetical protein